MRKAHNDKKNPGNTGFFYCAPPHIFFSMYIMIKNIFRICAILSVFLISPSISMAASDTCYAEGKCLYTMYGVAECFFCESQKEYPTSDGMKSCKKPDAASFYTSSDNYDRFHEYSCAWQCNKGTPYYDPTDGTCKECPDELNNTCGQYKFTGNSDTTGDANVWKQCFKITVGEQDYYVKYFTGIYDGPGCTGNPVNSVSPPTIENGEIFDGYVIPDTNIKIFDGTGNRADNFENNIKLILPDIGSLQVSTRKPTVTITDLCNNQTETVTFEFTGKMPDITAAIKKCNNEGKVSTGYFFNGWACDDGIEIEEVTQINADVTCWPSFMTCPKGYYCENGLDETGCPAGKTTTDTGSSTIKDCHYTEDTVFKYGDNGPTFKIPFFY